ncbi:MAG: hypothetical protein FLDDKLPJ_02431 [Phycisphaerae bacterium]|nr:hypothetical protein [Phycisphaerae bacterium]
MIGVNLIPMSIRHAQAVRRRVLAWAMAVSVVAGAGSLPAVLATVQAARLSSLEGEQLALSGALSRLRREHTETVSQIEAIHNEIERATTFRQKREWSALLALIGRAMPQDVWLESIATDPALPTATAAPKTAVPATPASAITAVGGSQTPPAPPGGSSSVTIEAPRKLNIQGMARTYESIQAYAANLAGTGVFSSVVLGRSTSGGAGPGSGAPGSGEAYRFLIVCEW